VTATGTRVAVVVPTRDRPVALVRCLRALERQTRPPDLVVVVDDNSTATPETAAVVTGSPAVRLVQAHGNGPAVARNLGAAAAAASGCEIVAFTDDDCVPAAGWLAALVQAVTAGAEAVAGPTGCSPVAGATDRAAQTITNHLVEESRGTDPTTVGFAPTCNLAVRATTLAEVPFDQDFPLAAGEDRDWCTRFAVSGRTIAFAPAARVEHRPDLTVAGFWRQQQRYGRGSQRFRAAGGPGRGRPPLAFHRRLLTRAVEQGPAVGALVAAAQLATAAGALQELVSRRGRATVRRR
jgi:GT2 family glycosyltransferase